MLEFYQERDKEQKERFSREVGRLTTAVETVEKTLRGALQRQDELENTIASFQQSEADLQDCFGMLCHTVGRMQTLLSHSSDLSQRTNPLLRRLPNSSERVKVAVGAVGQELNEMIRGAVGGLPENSGRGRLDSPLNADVPTISTGGEEKIEVSGIGVDRNKG